MKSGGSFYERMKWKLAHGEHDAGPVILSDFESREDSQSESQYDQSNHDSKASDSRFWQISSSRINMDW